MLGYLMEGCLAWKLVRMMDEKLERSSVERLVWSSAKQLDMTLADRLV